MPFEMSLLSDSVNIQSQNPTCFTVRMTHSGGHNYNQGMSTQLQALLWWKQETYIVLPLQVVMDYS